MPGYLSADIICSEKRTVFRERSSRKTVSYEEQIMSKDKYPNIFSPQMEAIVFIILQIFFATRAVLKIGEYPRIFPSIGPRDAFRPIARERKYLMDYKRLYHICFCQHSLASIDIPFRARITNRMPFKKAFLELFHI